MLNIVISSQNGLSLIYCASTFTKYCFLVAPKCDKREVHLRVVINTDQFLNDTYWDLSNDEGYDASNLLLNSTSYCVNPEPCYALKLHLLSGNDNIDRAMLSNRMPMYRWLSEFSTVSFFCNNLLQKKDKDKPNKKM